MDKQFNQRFDNLKGTELAAIYRSIAAIDEFKGWFKAGVTLSHNILGRLKKSTIVSSTGASTRIEGSKLTDAEIENMLKNISISKLTDRDSQEVAGYAEVLGIIFENYEHINFTENEIKNLHKILLKYSVKDEHHRGKYKNITNKVTAVDAAGKASVVFNPTEPYLVQAQMQALIGWTKDALNEKAYHPLLITANFILELLSIHPFQDGNGRLSRALTNLLMLKDGYRYVQYASLEKIIEDKKADYYVALRKSQANRGTKKENIIPWLKFFFSILLKQTEVARKLTGEEAGKNLLSENQNKTMNLFDTTVKITNKMVVEKLGINRNTAKQILNRLLILKLIQRTGNGRSIGYIKVAR